MRALVFAMESRRWKAGGAELDGEEGPGERGVEVGDFVGEGEEAVVEEFGRLAVAEVVIASVDEEEWGWARGMR